MLVCVSAVYSVSLLSRIPFYEYTTIYRSIVAGHLECFYPFATVNKAAMNFAYNYLCHILSFACSVLMGAENFKFVLFNVELYFIPV